MLIKIKELLGSIRFWAITATAVTAVLNSLVEGTFGASFMFHVIEIWLGAITAVGTFDSVATKLGKSIRSNR